MTKFVFSFILGVLMAGAVGAAEPYSQALPAGLYSLEQVECSLDGRTFDYRKAQPAHQEKTTLRVFPLDSLKGAIEYQATYVGERTADDCRLHFLLSYRLKQGGIEIAAHPEQGKKAALQKGNQRDGLGCRALDGLKTEFWTLQQLKPGMWSWLGEDLAGQCLSRGLTQLGRPAKIRYLMIRQSIPEVL